MATKTGDKRVKSKTQLPSAESLARKLVGKMLMQVVKDRISDTIGQSTHIEVCQELPAGFRLVRDNGNGGLLLKEGCVRDGESMVVRDVYPLHRQLLRRAVDPRSGFTAFVGPGPVAFQDVESGAYLVCRNNGITRHRGGLNHAATQEAYVAALDTAADL